LLVLAGGGAGAYFMFFRKPPAAEGKAEGKADGKAEKKGEKAEKGKKKEGEGEKKDGAAGSAAVVVTEGPDGVFFCTLPNMVANMQAADGRPTYLKLKITLEAPNQEAADMIQPALPRIQDMFQGFLRELRPEDLQGSQGTFQLRREVLRRVNLVIAPARVNSVLIEEMLIS
jgi:flagellar FliL protein